MLQKIKRLSMQRWPWMLLILSCLGLLASALYFQYGLNLQPCIKCIYIRSAFVGVLLAAIIGLLAPANALFRLLAVFGVLAAAGFGIMQANELLHIEQLLAEGGFSAVRCLLSSLAGCRWISGCLRCLNPPAVVGIPAGSFR